MREWIAQRGQASVEARNDDDPSKMKEEEWRGGARLSFLMSIGSDSLLNAAMISRSGRGRTRPRSLAGSRDRDSIRGDVGRFLFSSYGERRVCDTHVSRQSIRSGNID